MASNEQIVVTRVLLNTEQAREELEKLGEKVKSLEAKRNKAWENNDIETWKKLGKEIEKTEKKARGMEGRIKNIDRTLNNMSNAGPKQLKDTIKAIYGLLNSGTVERNSEQWKALTASLKQAKAELSAINAETKEGQSLWQRFTGFVDGSWSGIAAIISGITGLSMTIRKAVQEYGKMEEAMADTRKYTGLSDAAIRDLNESLKEMDTRTSREALNELAGAAGRLGKTSKKDILEFVEAGDKIKVALGDDLGEGAIDNVGKLAMAFGEDKEKGLRGAMLSTGSAINELAQNSSAQAGYLVDFTARVAGFGKQIGLTQAQIMGFGAVMDENLLRDEMAATAFGNMLTKMQTDTEKFARIAGKSVKDFTELLSRDANAAILAVADSLKRQDPTTMMKMLDDMELDGSRAVGVLSTLADKIDDVRKRQQLATEAYEEGMSVEREYNTMNNTVQAGIDKAKKSFQEVTVALGEQLMPVVKYTISSFALMVKGLYVLTKFVTENGKALAILATEAALLAAAYGAATIKTKAIAAAMLIKTGITKGLTAITYAWRVAVLAANVAIGVMTGNITKASQAMAALNTMTKSNPYTALLAVVLALGTAIYALVDRFRGSSKEAGGLSEKLRALRTEHEMMKGVNEAANKSVAEEVTRFKELRKQLEDNKTKIEDRKKALEEIKKIVPEYHGKLTTENRLINNNTSALDDYITNLTKAARVQAAFNKMVEIQGETLNHESTLAKREGNRQYALNQLKSLGATGESSFHHLGYGNYQMFDKDGKLVKMVTQEEKKRIEQYQDLVKYNDKRIAQEKSILAIQQKQTNSLQKVVEANGGYKEPSKDETPVGGYKTAAEEKKAAAYAKKLENKRKKQLEEEKRQLKEREDAVKAATDAEMATKTHEYAVGKIAYREYIAELARLQKEGLEKRRDVYEAGSSEYEKLNRKVEELNIKGDQQVNRMKEEDLRRGMLRLQAVIEAQAANQVITEEEKQKRLQNLEEAYLADRVALYQKGTKERMDAEWELEQVEQRNKLQRQQQYMQEVQQVREQYLNMSDERVKDIALRNLDKMYDEGLLKEREYQEAKLAIEEQYANYETKGEKDQRVGSEALKVAQSQARQSLDDSGSSVAGLPILGDIALYQSTMGQLKYMYQTDQITYEQYLAAKQQATSEFCASIAAQMQAAYNTVNQVLSAASSYFSAQQEYETAMVKKKYEKQIEAAGNNQKKAKQLQEKQQKEEAAIKSKYAKRAAAIQMAQAVAQTAISAINAYSSAVAIPLVGHILAPIAAGMAIAAGMLQIATIKKQQQVQEAGYYEGGYTGGRNYRREAGVVHEGEFVANHQAVENPSIVPFLDFIDQAQRNNTVGSLTMQDVTRAVGTGSAPQVITPIVNVNTSNEELIAELVRVREVEDSLIARLQEPIDARVVLTGPDGLNAKQEELNRMTKNK